MWSYGIGALVAFVIGILLDTTVADWTQKFPDAEYLPIIDAIVSPLSVMLVYVIVRLIFIRN